MRQYPPLPRLYVCKNLPANSTYTRICTNTERFHCKLTSYARLHKSVLEPWTRIELIDRTHTPNNSWTVKNVHRENKDGVCSFVNYRQSRSPSQIRNSLTIVEKLLTGGRHFANACIYMPGTCMKKPNFSGCRTTQLRWLLRTGYANERENPTRECRKNYADSQPVQNLYVRKSIS